MLNLNSSESLAKPPCHGKTEYGIFVILYLRQGPQKSHVIDFISMTYASQMIIIHLIFWVDVAHSHWCHIVYATYNYIELYDSSW